MAKNRNLFLVDYCLTPHVKIPNAGILCEGNDIIGIGGASAFSFCEEGLTIIKLENVYALPGFIDCHVHVDSLFSSDAPEKGMNALCKYLAEHGVTAFVPALRTSGRDDFIRIVPRLAPLVRRDSGGAYPFGIHLDGPFINAKMLFSHPAEFVSEIDLGYARELIDAGAGKIKLLTFAPELKNSGALIELLLENGIIPSIGHSLADEEETLRAIDAGARRATDMFTSVPPLDYRKPSVTDVILTDDRVSMEIITDGSFLSRRSIDLSMRVKPRKNVIAISDSFCCDPEKLDFAALDAGWRNLKLNHAILDTDAAACFTSNPAENIGLVSRGELCPGKFADIVFFNTADNSVHSTFVAGKNVFSAAPDVFASPEKK